MELVIENHFTAQTKYSFEDICYYHPKSGWAFGTMESGFKKADVIDFCFIEGNKVLSMLEIWVCEKYNEIQVSFVETSESHRKEKLATKLYDTLINWMKKNHPNKKLYRGYPGVKCPIQFTEIINKKLNENRIDYYFGGQNAF